MPKMGRQLAKTNVYDLLSDLKSCSRKRDIQEGKRVHRNAMETGADSNMYVAAALINMYAKCGSMIDARQVFDGIEDPNAVSWNTLIMGYAGNGQGHAALEMFFRMKALPGCSPNSVTYLAAIKACTSVAEDEDESGKADCLKRGTEIHLEIGCHLSHFVQNTLINMYAKCGSMAVARRMFDSILKPDVVSWNTLILGYAENGNGYDALKCFSSMKAEFGCAPNSVTYLGAVKACMSLAVHGKKEEGLKHGREIHMEIGDLTSHLLQSTLVNMYAKCGSMVDARSAFNTIMDPNVVSCTVLMMGYVENGEGQAALEFFFRMKTHLRCAPNSVTYIAAIKACTSLETGKKECLKLGREIHLEIGHHMNHVVQNTLISMYARCDSMIDALGVFNSIKDPDVVSWTALILGYAGNGEGQAALELFSRMKTARVCPPDSVTYVAVLKACGSIGAIAIGRKFHSEITNFDVHVVTCLVDFYARCGSMVEAREVFDLHSRARNITTWNVLLAGYGSFGDVSSVFSLFKAIQDQGFHPDVVTFVCLLSCCSHAGLVEKAREYLEAMPGQYGVIPVVIHYNCMIDVLCRANRLDEAVALVQEMPCHPDAVTWMALLGACRKWKNVEIGTLVFQSLVDLNEKNAAAYELMAQIYASKGMWKEKDKVMESRRKFGDSKLHGEAYVMDETGKMVKFMVGEEDPAAVIDKLKELYQGMKEHGYVSSSHKLAGAECGHNERRAVVYGILNTPPGESVRTFKNRRMCDDCHFVTKIFSKLSKRVIIIRDESGFHVMKNGDCSCGEYW